MATRSISIPSLVTALSFSASGKVWRLKLQPGYDGAGCEIAPPPSTRAEIAPHALAALCAMVFVAATLGGLALKVVSDQRRRARLIRYIQESDAQAPFVSGELKRAVGAP